MGKEQSFIFLFIMEPNNYMYQLSLPVVPSTDACSKAILLTEKVKDIIIRFVVAKSFKWSDYYIASTEYSDRKQADISYYPKTLTKPIIHRCY